MYELKEKVVLITGGASGIGFACAKEVLRAGAHAVAIADINEANGEIAKAELITEYGAEKVLFIKTDVTKQDQFENAFKETIRQWKYVDVLVNNAGIFNDRLYEALIATNATSVVHGTLLGLKYMGKDKGGKGGTIVNMSSRFGLEGNDCVPVYAGTKHFIIGFSRSMGTPYYYERTSVRVISICPGFTATPLTTDPSNPNTETLFPELKQLFLEKYPNIVWQPPASVATCVVSSLVKGENGSVWVVEDNEHYEVVLPDRKTLRK